MLLEIQEYNCQLPACNAFTIPVKRQLLQASRNFKMTSKELDLTEIDQTQALKINKDIKTFITTQTISIANTITLLKSIIESINKLADNTSDLQVQTHLEQFANQLSIIHSQMLDKISAIDDYIQFNVYTDKNNINNSISNSTKRRFDEDPLELKQAILALIPDIKNPIDNFVLIDDYELPVLNMNDNHKHFIETTQVAELIKAFTNPETREFVNTLIQHPQAIITMI